MSKKTHGMPLLSTLCCALLLSACGGGELAAAEPTSAPAAATTSDGRVKAQSAPAEASITAVLSGGNSFITKPGTWASERIDDQGLHDWTGNDAVISTYVNIAKAGELTLALRAQPAPGTISNVILSVAGRQFYLKLQPNGGRAFMVGKVTVPAGYLRIDLQGGSKNAIAYPDIQGFELSGPASVGAAYASDASNFYWSRRGASVHMNYTTPANTDYFYNELTIPKGQDSIGSYFMANGFGEGYFGMQVKEQERWVLFSVWDAAEAKTQLVRKGEGVVVNDFGGEGTGGQSYLVYPWKAGSTYPFITRVRPDGQGNTLYSAWFYATEDKRWRFIATWKRPQTDTWLTRAHSFAENFIDGNGYQGRRMKMGRQWAISKDGTWSELTSGWFTTDDTGNQRQRLDFAGGLDGDQFYLRMGGFFNDGVAANQSFERPAGGARPQVQLNLLPQ